MKKTKYNIDSLFSKKMYIKRVPKKSNFRFITVVFKFLTSTVCDLKFSILYNSTALHYRISKVEWTIS